MVDDEDFQLTGYRARFDDLNESGDYTAQSVKQIAAEVMAASEAEPEQTEPDPGPQETPEQRVKRLAARLKPAKEAVREAKRAVEAIIRDDAAGAELTLLV